MTPLLLLPLLAASMQAAPAPAQSAWAPTSKWVVRFDEDKCAAIRQFGSAGRTLQVDIRPALMEEHWWLNIEAPERPKKLTMEAKATVLIGNVVVPDIVNTVSLSTRPGHTIYSLQLSGAPLEQLRNAGALTLRTEQSSYDIPLADLVALGKTLDVCTVDLLESWGFPKQQQGRMATGPKPLKSLMAHIGSDDYPKEAVRQNASGTVRVRLTIAADGQLRECRVMTSSGNSHLDRATCDVARRVKFLPAVDRAGQPMAAPYFTVMQWRLH